MQLSAESSPSQQLAYLASNYCDMTKKGLSVLAATGNPAFISHPHGVGLLQNATKGHHEALGKIATNEEDRIGWTGGDTGHVDTSGLVTFESSYENDRIIHT